MELQQAQSQSIESALHRRLQDTRPTSAPRPFHPAPRTRAALGPRLVQRGDTPAPNNPLRPATKPIAKILQLLALGKARRPYASNILPIRPDPPAKVDERLLFLMAALGPLIWLAHAVLVWLHIIR